MAMTFSSVSERKSCLNSLHPQKCFFFSSSKDMMPFVVPFSFQLPFSWIFSSYSRTCTAYFGNHCCRQLCHLHQLMLMSRAQWHASQYFFVLNIFFYRISFSFSVPLGTFYCFLFSFRVFPQTSVFSSYGMCRAGS